MWDFSSITQYLSSISIPDMAPYRAMASSRWSEFYGKLPDIRALAREYIPKGYNAAKPILWEHRYRMVGALAISACALRVIHYYRSLPQYPIAQLATSLDVGRLSIETVKSQVVPPNVTLTFCIDLSSSMRGVPEAAVKKGANSVLESAKKAVSTVEGAQIEIALVGFNTDATMICHPTKISESSFDQIKARLDGYQSSGMTRIITGLDKATTTLEAMAKKEPGRVHTLILLSDGDEMLDASDIQPIHDRLKRVNAQLFAIGIGAGHKKTTLQAIAPSEGKFTGTYIDTTEVGGETIEGAISRIYEQAVAVFRELTLSTTQLKAGTWSVGGEGSVEEKGRSVCALGSFTEKEIMDKRIVIHREGLKEPLDLGSVSFNLDFTDPRGRKGTMPLSWNPTTIMDPAILNRARLIN